MLGIVSKESEGDGNSYLNHLELFVWETTEEGLRERWIFKHVFVFECTRTESFVWRARALELDVHTHPNVVSQQRRRNSR